MFIKRFFLKTVATIVACFAMCFIVSCDKTGDDPDNPENPDKPKTTMLDINLTGLVNDLSGNPLSGVRVTTGSLNATTDSKGEFSFQQAGFVDNRAIIKYEKNGYFTLIRSGVKVNEMYIEAVMTPKGNSANSLQISFDAAAGATLQIAGAKVVLPPSGIAKKDGSNYSGTVKADMHYLDPNTKNFAAMMPGGNYAGINKSGQEVMLLSFGVIGVELTDNQNNPLQLKSDSPAEVTWPVPANLSSNLPATVPISSFDEQKGLWIEEGAATLRGDVYVGTVTHFSDKALSQLEFYRKIIKGRVIDCKNQPIVRANVYIEASEFELAPIGGPGNRGLVITFLFRTDANGEWQILIPEVMDVDMIAAWTNFTSDADYTEKYSYEGGIFTSKVCAGGPVEFLPANCSYEYYLYEDDGTIHDHWIFSWQNYGKRHRYDNVESSRTIPPNDEMRYASIEDHEARISWTGIISKSEGEKWYPEPGEGPDDPGDGSDCSHNTRLGYPEFPFHNSNCSPVMSDEARMCEPYKDVAIEVWSLQRETITVAGKPCKVYLLGYAPMGLVGARYCFWEGVLMKEEVNNTGIGATLRTTYEVKNITLNPPSSVFTRTMRSWF
jgi:hypothetical protein